MQLSKKLTTKTTKNDEIDENDNSLHWKIKAIASKIMYRMFVKYSDPKKFEKADLGGFGKVNVFEFSLSFS